MKLLIDIPEKVVTSIQNGEDYRYDIHTAIAQGVPYEERSQGDLISREALKKSIKSYADDQYAENEYLGEYAIMDIIDKAPVVDLTKNQAYDKGFITAMKLYSKPKGEWIIVDDTEKFIAKCSVCGRIEDSRMVKYHPFCHCGARMKGSDNE